MAQGPLISNNPLYDRVFILSTTSGTDLSFFAVPRGGADPNASTVTKTYADTNMANAKRLSEPESFDVDGIAFQGELGITRADVQDLGNKGWLELSLSGDSVVAWRSPLRSIGGGGGLFTAGTGDSAQFGYPSPASITRFQDVLRIDRGETFSVKLGFSSAPSLAADRRVTCYLHGRHYLAARV